MPITRPKFTDPTGPGTSAWEQFDLAVATWRAHCTPGWSTHNPLAYHKYHNHRAAMLVHLRKHGANEAEWLRDLVRALEEEAE